MKRKNKTLLIILAVLILIVGYGIYHFFYDIDAIKPGEKIAESASPSGKYTITAYLNNGGATTGYAVLCRLDDGKRVKNIYWDYDCNTCDIVWIDDDTAQINGVRLENVKRDTYDFRRYD